MEPVIVLPSIVLYCHLAAILQLQLLLSAVGWIKFYTSTNLKDTAVDSTHMLLLQPDVFSLTILSSGASLLHQGATYTVKKVWSKLWHLIKIHVVYNSGQSSTKTIAKKKNMTKVPVCYNNGPITSMSWLFTKTETWGHSKLSTILV